MGRLIILTQRKRDLAEYLATTTSLTYVQIGEKIGISFTLVSKALRERGIKRQAKSLKQRQRKIGTFFPDFLSTTWFRRKSKKLIINMELHTYD